MIEKPSLADNDPPLLGCSFLLAELRRELEFSLASPDDPPPLTHCDMASALMIGYRVVLLQKGLIVPRTPTEREEAQVHDLERHLVRADHYRAIGDRIAEGREIAAFLKKIERFRAHPPQDRGGD